MHCCVRLPLAAVLTLTGAGTALQSQSAISFVRYDAAAIGAPRAIVSADFNRDGFADVAVGGTTRASIGILLHHGWKRVMKASVSRRSGSASSEAGPSSWRLPPDETRRRKR